MPEQPGAGRLAPETLAAYIDGLLPPEERARVETEIAADPESYEWVVISINAVDDEAIMAAAEPERDVAPTPAPKPEPQPAPPPGGGSGGDRKLLPFYRRRSVQGVLGTLLATAAALVMVVRTPPVWWQDVWGPSVDPRFAKLVEAVGEERYIEARLTGGFKFGPLRQTMRGVGPRSLQNLRLVAAAGELQKASDLSPRADTFHAFGVAQLLLGDVDTAIELLERALPERRANVVADLVAALYSRWRTTGETADLVRALDLVEEVLADPQTRAQALYNKALCLEGLGLPEKALETWKAYLEEEHEPAWREEGARAVLRLTRQQSEIAGPDALIARAARGDLSAATEFAAKFSRQAREFVEDVALPRWGAGVMEGRDLDAMRWLDVAEAIAHRMPRGSPVRSMLEAIRTTSRYRGFAEAHRIFGAAREMYAVRRASDSMPLFRSVVERTAGTDALHIAAQLNLATAQYAQGHLSDAAARFSTAAAMADTSAFHAYRARAEWMQGVIAGAKSQFAASLQHYAAATRWFDEAGETDYAVVVAQIEADVLSTLGDHRESWKRLADVLRYWATHSDPARRTGAVLLSGILARRAGLPRAGAIFAEYASELSERDAQPSLRIEAVVELARNRSEAGDTRGAATALEPVRRLLASIPDPGLRRQLEGRVVRAEAAAETRPPADDVKFLKEAADYYESTGSSLQLAEVYLLLGRSLRRTGDRSAAAGAFDAGIRAIEARRGAPPNSQLRISYFDSVWSLYEEAIDLAFESGEPGRAFSLSELGRFRSLGDAGSSGRLVSELELSEQLAEHEAAVVFSVALGRTRAWVIRRGRSLLHDLGSISDSVKQHTDNLDRRPTPGRQLQDLYNELWRPLQLDLGGATRVFVVPVGVLWRVPFSALLDEERGRYVVQDTVISTVPGVRFFWRSQGANRRSADARVVATQTVRGTGAWTPLAFAGREVAEVLRIHGGSPAEYLTAETLLADLQTADLVHFAGHAIVNESFPELSYLALGGSQGDERLLVKDIESAHLLERPVVVLSACSTGKGLYRRGEGPLSIARQFLGAGAVAVVATQWDVADRDMFELFRSFHEELKSGVSPAEALARAQREAAAKSRAGDWAAVTITEHPTRLSTLQPWPPQE